MLATKITSRDFKRARPGGMRFDLGRWREFGVGLAVGLSLSLLVLIWQNYREKNPQATEIPRPEPRAGNQAAAGDAEEAATNFGFYEMLPKFEVVVPEKEREVASSRGDTRAPIETPGVYVLQAGSYGQQADADRVRAQLKMQGIDAIVQRVAVDDDVWHRVRIGPITDLAEINRLRNRLRVADFDDVLVVRVGD